MSNPLRPAAAAALATLAYPSAPFHVPDLSICGATSAEMPGRAGCTFSPRDLGGMVAVVKSYGRRQQDQARNEASAVTVEPILKVNPKGLTR